MAVSVELVEPGGNFVKIVLPKRAFLLLREQWCLRGLKLLYWDRDLGLLQGDAP